MLLKDYVFVLVRDFSTNQRAYMAFINHVMQYEDRSSTTENISNHEAILKVKIPAKNMFLAFFIVSIVLEHVS